MIEFDTIRLHNPKNEKELQEYDKVLNSFKKDGWEVAGVVALGTGKLQLNLRRETPDVFEYDTIRTDGYYVDHCRHCKAKFTEGWELVGTVICPSTSTQFAHFKKQK